MPDSKPFLTHVACGLRRYLPEMRSQHRAVVYLAIMSRVNDKSGTAMATIPMLAGDTGCDAKTVKLAIKWLETAGLLAVTHRLGRPNVFTPVAIAYTNEPRQLSNPVHPADPVHQTDPVHGKDRVHDADPVRRTASDPVRPTDSDPVRPTDPIREGYEKEIREEEAADAARGPAGRSSRRTDGVDEVQAEGGHHHTQPPAKKGSPRGNDEALTAIKSDLSCMTLAGHLLYGKAAAGLGREDWKALKPGNAHWAPTSRDYTRPEPDASLAALAAYASYRINAARVATGQPIELLSIPKLIGVVKNLRRGMTQAELVAAIDAIGLKWQQVQAALPNWFTLPLMNETLLTSDRVLEAARSVAAGRPATAQTPSSMPAVPGYTAQQVADIGAQHEANFGRRRIA